MSAPQVLWCEHSGMILRQVDDGTWMVLDAVGEADAVTVDNAEPMYVTPTDRALCRFLCRTGLPFAVLVVMVTVVSIATLGPDLGGAVAINALVFGVVGWMCWSVWLTARSPHLYDKWYR
jgi:hypothetical protein